MNDASVTQFNCFWASQPKLFCHISQSLKDFTCKTGQKHTSWPDDEAPIILTYFSKPLISIFLLFDLPQSLSLYTRTVHQSRVHPSARLCTSHQAFGPLMSLGEWWHVMQGTMTLFSSACFRAATARTSLQHVAINCNVLWRNLIDTNLTPEERPDGEKVKGREKRQSMKCRVSAL